MIAFLRMISMPRLFNIYYAFSIFCRPQLLRRSVTTRALYSEARTAGARQGHRGAGRVGATRAGASCDDLA